MRITKLVAAVASLALLASAPTKAAPIPWSQPTGATSGFTYDSGNTDNQLFVPAGTSPVATSTGFIFTPTAFRATSSNGTASVVSDTVRVVVHALAGHTIQDFAVNEFGDYSILGGGPNTAVKAFGELVLTNLDNGQVQTETLQPVPPTPPALFTTGINTPNASGAWEGGEDIALVQVPNNWKNVSVVLNNILQATSDPGTTSFIEKKIVTPAVTITLILPEPGSIALLAGAAAFAFGRRRRVEQTA